MKTSSGYYAIVVGSLCAIEGVLWARGEWAGVMLGALWLAAYGRQWARGRAR